MALRAPSKTGALRKVLLLVVPSFALAFALLELGVLSRVVAVDDVPIEWWEASTGIIKYRPHQAGVSFPDGDRRHPVRFTINADGWNSFHPEYALDRSERARIAVIGDSYVAAFQVEPRQSLSGRLETMLGPERAEVYSFGMNGAPLSQYLHVARYVVERYRPDAIGIVLVHNDFDESVRHIDGRYTGSFLRLAVTEQGVEEIPPRPYRPSPLLDWFRVRSSTFRFLFYRGRVGSQLLRDIYFRAKDAEPARYEANVDVTTLESDSELLRRATAYVFAQLALLQRASHIPIVLLMDTPRFLIYEGRDPSESQAYRLNRLVADLAARSGVAFVDLSDAFRLDWGRHGRRLEFSSDGHWNAHAHRLAAHELCHALEGLRVVSDGACRRRDLR